MVSFNHFSLWIYLSSLFFALFSFLFRNFDGGKNLETSDELQPPEEEADGGGADEIIIDEKGNNEFVFSFKFQTYEDFSRSNKVTERFDSLSNKYEFFPEKITSHFVEEAQIPSFTVEVLNSSSNYEVLKNGDFSVLENSKKVLEFEGVDEKITELYENQTEEQRKLKQRVQEDHEFERETDIGSDYDANVDDIGGGFFSDFDIERYHPKDETEEIEQSSSNYREEQVLEKQRKLKQRDEQDNDFGRETDVDSDYDTNVDDIRVGFLSNFDSNKYELNDEINKTDEIEQSSSNYRKELATEKQRKTDIGSNYETNVEEIGVGFLSNIETEEINETEETEQNSTNYREKQRKLKQIGEEDIDLVRESEFGYEVDAVGYETDEEMNEGSGEDIEEFNELEREWEHQELIEQLKMEMKKVRAKGLPTIYEESESPKIMGELKPWKIDERFKHGDLMEEIHKFYTTYRERMRKLDIFNYQKMYAMGVLQSKDPLKSYGSNNSKSSSPSITSLLRLYRQKKCQVDPMKDFIREIHCDLEIVYVGQMCLSWEFLQWQYEKALDLWESEPHGVLHHYNEVASEFQQFQVLLQRFLENEAFEGPRVQNYIKHRCVARNLLQIPVIREDKIKDKRKTRWRDHGNEASTNDMLVEILQESIRVIWKFIRTDKDQRHKKFHVELQDPADRQLLIEIQADLHKKERKLKEIVRSGHCILKKLKKNEEEDGETEGSLGFFCEVDMKLIGRVLKMSRITTDQLVWCRNKLSRINFFNRKIHVEPSFFLFPC